MGPAVSLYFPSVFISLLRVNHTPHYALVKVTQSALSSFLLIAGSIKRKCRTHLHFCSNQVTAYIRQPTLRPIPCIIFGGNVCSLTPSPQTCRRHRAHKSPLHVKAVAQ